MTRRLLHAAVCLAVLFVGCGPSRDRAVIISAADSTRADSLSRAHQDSINRSLPGYVVDSILPVSEELRRFRTAVGGRRVTRLNGGSASREALIQRFVIALERRDSSELNAMLLDRREFADVVYPESPYARPPYRQSPALVWTSIRNPSVSGLRRLVRRLGGQRLHYAGHECSGSPDRQGRNRIWTDCRLRLVDARGNVISYRLFGSIIERGREFKIVSYANDF
ncbi:MAG TPA: hypothetical protein VIF83_01180 [Gemmatimonadaceae bacterium]